MSIFGAGINWVRISAACACCIGLVALTSLGAGPCYAGQGPDGAREDGAHNPAVATVTDSAAAAPAQNDDSWESTIMLPEIVARLQKILPDSWEVSAIKHNQTPRKWAGSPEGILIRLENPSITAYDPNGFEYHPFFRIWLCPTLWGGNMEDVRFREESDWPVMLGQNHRMKVLYLSQGFNDWKDGPTLLRKALNLTSLPITRSLREKIDPEIMMKVFPKLAVAGNGQPGLRDRIVGLEMEGPLAYVEYATATVLKEHKPDQVQLSRCDEPGVVRLMDRENQSLASMIMLAYPEVQTVYLRRVCDEFASDRIINRSDAATPKEPVALSRSSE